MKRPAAGAILLLFLLPGCFGSGNGTPPTADACVTRVCLLESETHDSKLILDRYGLHQITQSLGALAESIDGDLAVWLIPEEFENGTSFANLVGYSFSQQRLIPFAVSTVYKSTLPRLADGRLLFSQEPKYWAPDGGNWTYLALWENEDEGWQRVPTGLDAEQLLKGFDWPWATFTARGTPNGTQDGMWAMNLETGYKTPLGPHPLNRTSPELVTVSTVAEETAYYTVWRPSTQDVRVEERVLASEITRTIFSGIDMDMYGYDTSNRYVSWITNARGVGEVATVYDRQTSEVIHITNRTTETAHDVRVGGDWVVYIVAPRETSYLSSLEAFHIPTRTRHVLLPDQKEGDGFPQRADTDGDKVLVTFTLFSEDYDHRGETNAYWMELPRIS